VQKQNHKRTLKALFEFTNDDIVDAYEVVRSVGFTLKCKSGEKEFRLEAIKRPAEKFSSVLVWERQDNGAWELNLACNEASLHRVHPDLALRSMVLYMTQHLPPY
jgi:hypothetical protein